VGHPSGDDEGAASLAPTLTEAVAAPTLVVPDAASKSTIRPPRTSSSDQRYTLGNEIARGGMGRVVEATDNRLGRVVALKEALTADDELRRRFERETRITARLEHPSIVPVHDAGTMADGSPFYVMRKVSGQPLEHLVREAKTLPKRLALLPNLLAAANAVAHAHSRGVVHRDLKPSNILVGEHGETIVIDWGLAKLIGEPDDSRDSVERIGEDNVQTRFGSVVGTPGFMSPEQLKGQPVDARSDVYALGANLYFLLSRRLPHAAQTGDDMMKEALAGPPTPIDRLVEGAPDDLVTIVEKALAYASADRYHDGGGFAEDVDRFLKGQLVAAHRYSFFERILRFYRRHRISVTVTSIALIALAVGGTIAVRRIIAEKTRADVALEHALDRNEALELANARSLLATNPTAALAQIKPLAAKRWREVRLIALAARAAGVARGLPAARQTLSLEVSRDGTRLLASGDDGVVRLHDLAGRSVRTVTELGAPMHVTFADDERAIVAWSTSRIAVIDASRGSRRELRVQGQPFALRSDGARVWWIAWDGKAYTFPLDGESTQIAIAEPVHALEVRGDVVALAGDKHLWLVRDGTPNAVAEGKAHAIASSPDGRLAAIIGNQVVVLDGTRVIQTVEHRDAHSLAWQNGRLYVGGTGTVTPLGGTPIQVGDGNVERLLAGPGDSLIARTSMNAVTVLDRHVIVDLPPTSAIGVVAASPTSRFVLAGSDEVVLAWDLDQVLPRRIALPGAVTGSARGPEQVVAATGDRDATWFDIKTGALTELALASPFDAAAFAPDGERLVIVDKARRATLYHRDGSSTMLAGNVSGAQFAGRDLIAFVTPTGEVHLQTIGGGEAMIFDGKRPAWQLEARGDWIVVLFDDRSLWRYNVRTKASSQLPAVTHRWMLLLDDGDVAITDSASVRIWRPNGSFIDYPSVTPPTNWLFRAGANHFVVYSGGDGAHVAEIGGARRVAQAYPPGSRMFDLNFGHDSLGVHVDSGGGLYMTQPVTGDHWRVAKPWRDLLRTPGITPDETHLFAVALDSVLVWTQSVPRNGQETVALIEELTNARAAGSGHEVRLIWR
jgi:hypothetical protein